MEPMLRWIGAFSVLSDVWFIEVGRKESAALPHAIPGLALVPLNQQRLASFPKMDENTGALLPSWAKRSRTGSVCAAIVRPG